MTAEDAQFSSERGSDCQYRADVTTLKLAQCKHQEIAMRTPVRTTQVSEIWESLGKLIKDPKSLGLREDLPPGVLAMLTSAREILRERTNERTSITVEQNDLAAELSQDADTHRDVLEDEHDERSFSRLLCGRMDQLHLSNYDVAVSIGCTVKHVCDLITGLKMPTEMHISELALLLGVTRESLTTAAKLKRESAGAAL